MSYCQQSVVHPSFLTHARQVTHSKGNQPGFPFQFQYTESQKQRHPTHENMEWNVSYINGDVGIAQIRRPGSIIGQYEAMVPDLPYNPPYENQLAASRAAMGLGMIGIGSLFFI